MKKNKFYGIIIFTVIFAAMLAFSFNVSAASPTLSLSDASVKAGSDFSVDVTLTDNPGLIVMRAFVEYDDRYFSIKSVKDGGILGDNTHSVNYTESPYVLFWTNPLRTTDITGSGKIATITFSTLQNMPDGIYEVKIYLEKQDVLKADLSAEGDIFTCVSSKITVSGGTASQTSSSSSSASFPANTGKPSVTLSDANIYAGQEFDVTLRIDNNPGIIALRSQLSFNDKYFSVVGIKDHGLIGQCTSLENTDESPYVIYCSDPLSEKNIEKDGKIVTITFYCEENTPSGKYTFTHKSTDSDIVDADMNAVGNEFTFVKGTVSVGNKSTDASGSDSSDADAANEYSITLSGSGVIVDIYSPSISYGEGTLISFDTSVLKSALNSAKALYPSKNIDVVIKSDTVSDDIIIVNIPKGYAQTLEAASSFKFSLYQRGSVSFDSRAVNELKSVDDSVQIIFKKKSLDRDVAEKLVNGYEYYCIEMSHKLSSGSVEISLPYANSANIDGKYIVVYSTDGKKLYNIAGEPTYSNGTISFTDSTVKSYVVTVEQLGFEDIENHWARNSINFVSARGIFNGRSETQFDPDSPISRGMIVTVLGRLEGIDISDYNCMFSDVDKNQYYAPYIEWARRNGIVGGSGDNMFEPDRGVSRQELAVIIARYLRNMKGCNDLSDSEITYSDSSDIDSWAKADVNKVGNAGIITGSDGKFLPRSEATRAQAAAILERVVKFTA